MTTLGAKKLIVIKGLNPKLVNKITNINELQNHLGKEIPLINNQEKYISIELADSNFQNFVSIFRLMDNETVYEFQIYELT